MTHSRKVEAYRRLTAEKGIAASTAVPPLWELLWSWGIRVPPPLCIGFLPLAILGGMFFGVVFGALAWLMGNRGLRTMPLEEAGTVALISGAMFGVTMAWLARRLARKHGLGAWSAVGASRLNT